MKTLDKILKFLAFFLIAFIICMIVLFCIFQSVPDTLITCVLGTGLGELIMTTIITVVKKKYKSEKEENENEIDIE